MSPWLLWWRWMVVTKGGQKGMTFYNVLKREHFHLHSKGKKEGTKGGRKRERKKAVA